MTASLPTRACLISLGLGLLSWLCFFSLPLLGSEAEVFRGTVWFLGLLLLMPANVLAAGIGFVLFSYFGLCYHSNSPKQPVVVRCGLYLLPSLAFCGWMLLGGLWQPSV